MIKGYIHKVHYYETDQMGIVHHSNYIKWMEEARVDFLEQIGYSYARMEDEGLFSPVVSLECKYRDTCTFDDEIVIRVQVEEFRGVRLVLFYEMYHMYEGYVVLTARSTHCFTTRNGSPIILKKQYPELDQLLRSLAICKNK